MTQPQQWIRITGIVLLNPAYKLNIRLWLNLLLVWVKWIMGITCWFCSSEELDITIAALKVSLFPLYCWFFYGSFFDTILQYGFCATFALCRWVSTFYTFSLLLNFDLLSQTSLMNANEELERWKLAFINHSIIPPGIAPGMHAVGLTLKFLKEWRTRSLLNTMLDVILRQCNKLKVLLSTQP